MMWLFFAQMALGDIVIESDPIQQGSPITFRVVDSISSPIRSATVRMEVRPGLSSSSEWSVGLTDQDGRIEYTPKEGGPHRIIVGGDELIYTVRWNTIPAPTVSSVAVVCLGPLLAVWIRRKRRGVQ